MAFVSALIPFNTWANKRAKLFLPNKLGNTKCATVSALSPNDLQQGVRNAVITLDVGSSSVKSALYFIDEQLGHHDSPTLGQVFRREHHTTTGECGVLTQKPSDWYTGSVLAIRDVLVNQQTPSNILGISVTGQMQDLIAVGSDPPSLLESDAILYSDTRAVEQAEELSSILSTQVMASSLLAKLKLLPPPLESEGEPSYKLLFGAADYMVYILSGGLSGTFTDATTVSTTGLSVGPEHREYNVDTLKRAGLGSFIQCFPKILERTGRVGSLSDKVARDIRAENLTGIDVFHAGGDAFSATVGANCFAVDSGPYLYAGTSGWIAATISLEDYRANQCNRSLFYLGHAANRAVIVAASVSCVGSAIQYASREMLGCSVEELTSIAGESPIGSRGVVMVSYLSGRRCPRPVDRSSGCLSGIQMSTRRCDIARAVIEGVVFSFAEAYEELPNEVMGRVGDGLRAVGGVCGCAIFLQGVAALVERVTVAGSHEGEAGLVGAGRVAGERGGLAGGERHGKALVVDDNSRQEWKAAMRAWRQVVTANESIWG